MPWTNISNYFSNKASSLTVSQPLINPQVAELFQLICYGILSQVFAVFGIVTNTINIICFVKQGFKETINISLLSLAVSDLGCLITILWTNVFLVPKFQEFDLPFHAMDTMYLTSGVPHLIFTRITAVITAFITLERCLCITMPLKVAGIFISQRIVIINVCIYSVLFLSASPIYVSAKLAMKYYPELNKTVLGVIYTNDKIIIEKVSSTIHSVIIPFTSLLIIIVCTVTMVTTLRKQAKWRQTQQVSKGNNSSLERDQNVVKMIGMISILFVVSFCPSAVLFLGVTLEPDFYYGGKYYDITIMVYAFSNIAETINSSMNIFIYYRMSTRYRTIFRQIFCSTSNVKASNNHRPC